MANKTWFITGTSRGFGREWTKAALERGDRVAATARDTGTLDDLRAEHSDALLALALDVTDRDAAFDAVTQSHEHFGRLDIVVNNAGYGHFGMVEEISEQEARAQIETNLFGALWVAQPPPIRLGTPAAGDLEDKLAAGQQRRSRTAVRAIRHPRGSPDLIAPETAHLKPVVRDRGQRRQQQPRRPSRTGIAERRLEQRSVDLTLKPRASLREQHSHHRRAPPPAA
jgi:NAD(P)-dependent dehydrogenase (short-subunit alcohol dehydrogenase family)